MMKMPVERKNITDSNFMEAARNVNNNNSHQVRASGAPYASYMPGLDASQRMLKSLQNLYENHKGTTTQSGAGSQKYATTSQRYLDTKNQILSQPLVRRQTISKRNIEQIVFSNSRQRGQGRTTSRAGIPSRGSYPAPLTRSRTEPIQLGRGVGSNRLPPLSKLTTSSAELKRSKAEAEDLLATISPTSRMVYRYGLPRMTMPRMAQKSRSVFSVFNSRGGQKNSDGQSRPITRQGPKAKANTRMLVSIKSHISRSSTTAFLKAKTDALNEAIASKLESDEDGRRSRSRVREPPGTRSKSVSLARIQPPPTSWDRKLPRSRSVSMDNRLTALKGRAVSRGGDGSRAPSELRSSMESRRGFRSISRQRSETVLPYMTRANTRLSLASTMADDGRGKDSAGCLFAAIQPDNATTEKEKFFRSNFTCNPQFKYQNPPPQETLDKYSRASDKLMHLAIKIMSNAIKNFGTYEKYMEVTAGRPLSRFEIIQSAKAYLQKENLQAEVDIMLSEQLLSRARMAIVNSRPTVIIRAVNMRQGWVDGMLRHEIGTHYIRAWNNKQQTWGKAKRRQELGLHPANPTEEGLASIHSVLNRSEPCLWRCAILYYAVYQGTHMSLVELFRDLSRFVKDPEVRWEYCLRAKRGQTDTSLPGAFTKDQVYLKGALEILKNRNTIDFHLLVRCGKVSWRDLDKLQTMYPDYDFTKIPSFMEDIPAYKEELDRIVMKNGLTDADLEELT